MATTSPHRWRFSRFGGFDQARLDTADDLRHLAELDLKLWAALACPVRGLEFDERTLALIDTDQDGRVRASEVLEAVRWSAEHLKDVASIRAGSPSLALAQIDDRTATGKAILASARQILKDLGKAASADISLDDVSDTSKIFAQTRFNGDGVIPADVADDPATRAVLDEVIAALGSVPDRSGKVGADQARVDAFFAQAAAFRDWHAKSETDAAIRPFGDATTVAADAWRAVRPKVDDFFSRCRLAAFDARALPAVNRDQAEYTAVAAKDLSANAAEVAGFPVAHVEPSRALPLVDGVNPAWAAAMSAFRSAVVVPLHGKDKTSLTADEWNAVCAKLAPHEAWLAARPAGDAGKLAPARIREILAGASRDAITKLIAQDAALAAEAAAIAQVERLVRYHRDLHRLLCNFVNFQDFYSGDAPSRRGAVFQAGTLYLDQRACTLCVRVDDPGKHAALAGFSKACLAYCDLTRPSGEKMTIAAAFTGGDSDYLMVGRNGVFYDRKGRDWDATVTKLIDNPISVRQAFWSPYKKLVRLIEEQVAKRAAAADAESDARMAAASAAPGAAAAAPPPPPEPKKVDVGTVAALSVAFAGIGTLVATLLAKAAGLFELPFWLICLVFAGLLLVISGPSMLIAWLKLRQRNLAPILDANGWAVNGRVRLNVPFGASLTSVAELPPGSAPAATDPFAERASPWPGIIKFVVVVCFLYSLLNWFGLVHAALVRAGVEEKDIPAFVVTPEDVRKRGEKAKPDAEDPAKPAKAPEPDTPK